MWRWKKESQNFIQDFATFTNDKGYVISELNFGVFNFSKQSNVTIWRIFALTSKELLNQKNNGTLSY